MRTSVIIQSSNFRSYSRSCGLSTNFAFWFWEVAPLGYVTAQALDTSAENPEGHRGQKAEVDYTSLP